MVAKVAKVAKVLKVKKLPRNSQETKKTIAKKMKEKLMKMKGNILCVIRNKYKWKLFGAKNRRKKKHENMERWIELSQCNNKKKKNYHNLYILCLI